MGSVAPRRPYSLPHPQSHGKLSDLPPGLGRRGGGAGTERLSGAAAGLADAGSQA